MTDFGLSESELRRAQIFYLDALEHQETVIRDQVRFVHYTNASCAMNIIENHQVWMRKTTLMSDFSEVSHGIECLNRAWSGSIGDRIKEVMTSIKSDSVSEIERIFNYWIPTLENSTYVTSISEHDNTEDTYGRLSMWRAYGGKTGVALILNNHPFVAQAATTGIWSSRVDYFDDQRFEVEFERLATRMEDNLDYLSVEPSILIDDIFQVFRKSALCTKHPGFQEEREVRIVYNPDFDPTNQLESAIVEVSGTPQRIYKIPLHDDPENGFAGYDIPSLINRIIIGPTNYPFEIRDAFIDLLLSAGVDSPEDRIVVSPIPLRE